MIINKCILFKEIKINNYSKMKVIMKNLAIFLKFKKQIKLIIYFLEKLKFK
jgi:hypothetical protein